MSDTRNVIVVGVDGSDQSAAALRWAFGEARLRGADLHVVHAWSSFPAFRAEGRAALSILDETDLRAEGARLVEDFVARVVPDRADVAITVLAPQTFEGVAHSLVELADDAQMLVVGTRGLSSLSGLLVGSISAQCVHHGRCTVVVVREAAAEAAASRDVTRPSRSRSCAGSRASSSASAR